MTEDIFSRRLQMMSEPLWRQAAIDVHDSIDTARIIFKSQFGRDPSCLEVMPIWQALLERQQRAEDAEYACLNREPEE